MGRDYLINVLECKPQDQICCVEADINVDFAPPLDYVEPAPVQRQANANLAAQQNAKDQLAAKREEI